MCCVVVMVCVLLLDVENFVVGVFGGIVEMCV